MDRAPYKQEISLHKGTTMRTTKPVPPKHKFTTALYYKLSFSFYQMPTFLPKTILLAKHDGH
jgi:hypothetical protein